MCSLKTQIEETPIDTYFRKELFNLTSGKLKQCLGRNGIKLKLKEKRDYDPNFFEANITVKKHTLIIHNIPKGFDDIFLAESFEKLFDQWINIEEIKKETYIDFYKLWIISNVNEVSESTNTICLQPYVAVVINGMRFSNVEWIASPTILKTSFELLKNDVKDYDVLSNLLLEVGYTTTRSSKRYIPQVYNTPYEELKDDRIHSLSCYEVVQKFNRNLIESSRLFKVSHMLVALKLWKHFTFFTPDLDRSRIDTQIERALKTHKSGKYVNNLFNL